MDETKSRTCLRCGKDFESTGPGNRICSSCSSINNETMKKTAKIIITHKKPIMEDPN